MSASPSTPSPITMDSSARDVDRIIAGLDYNSFELLPGTVNPRPGMRYVEDPSAAAQFIDSEGIEDFRDSVLIEDVSDGSGSIPYLLPSAPYWQPFVIDVHHDDGGRKKKKNKKKRNKNRQRQLPYQFQLEVQVEQEQTQDDVTLTSPDISDGSSTESPTSSPVKVQTSTMELSPDKKGKKKRSKQRRRGSGRGRRLFPNSEDIDLMNVHLNGLNIGSNGGIYGKSDTYSIRSPHGPSYLGAPPGSLYTRGPLWVPHPVIYTQC